MRTKIGWPFLIAAVAVCAGACSGEQQPTSEGTRTIEEQPKQKEPITINFTGSTSAQSALDDLFLNHVREKLPHITVNYIRNANGSRVPDLLSQNVKIDMLTSGDIYYMNLLKENRLEEDMSPLVKEHTLDLTQFSPGLIEGLTTAMEGKMYAIPIYSMVQVLFYNKDIFNKFGVPYPKNGMTWEEAIELSKKLNRHEGGVQYVGLASFLSHMKGVNQLSLPYVNPKTGKPNFLDEAWKQVLDTYYIRPAQNDGYQSMLNTLKRLVDRPEFTTNQQVAMWVSYNSQPIDRPDEFGTFDWDIVSLPTMPNLPNVGSQPITQMIGISSMTKDAASKEAVMDIIKALVSKDYQMAYSKRGVLSVLKDPEIQQAFGKETRFPDKNWQAVYYNKLAATAPISEYWTDMDGLLGRNLLPVVTGQEDLNTMLRRIQEEGEKIIMQKEAAKK